MKIKNDTGSTFPPQKRTFNEGEPVTEDNTASLMDERVARIVLDNCLPFLDTPDLLRASQVSILWNELTSRRSLWRTIKLAKCRLLNPRRLVEVMKKYETQTLDLRQMVIGNYPRSDAYRYWSSLFTKFKPVRTLSTLHLGECPTLVTRMVCLGHLKNSLKHLSIRFVRGGTVDLSPLKELKNLKELHLEFDYLVSRFKNGKDSLEFKSLNYLSLKNNNKSGSIASFLTEDSQPLSHLPCFLLQQMPGLRKLRLEDDGSTWCSDYFLWAVAALQNLAELEMVNCRISTNFAEDLSNCTLLRKLYIEPNYNDSAFPSISVVLKGVQSLSDTLRTFKMGFCHRFLECSYRFVEAFNPSLVKQAAENPCFILIRTSCNCPEEVGYFCDIHYDFETIQQMQEMVLNLLPNMETGIIKLP